MKREDSSECGGCGAADGFFLHTLRHRAAYRRFCTNCVLRNHAGLFCPFCFEVYDETPPPSRRLLCLKCPSLSHLSCAGSSSASPSPSWECPPCSNPNFTFFPANHPNKRIKPENGDGGALLLEEKSKTIDVDSAKALVAAAKIAAASMTRAASVARVEAERRIREALLAKKRAKEALERVSILSKEREDKDAKDGTIKQVHVTAADHKSKPRFDAEVMEHNKLIQN